MSRFRNLEFGEQTPGENQRQESVSDEALHLGEAQAAFEQGEYAVALREYSKVLEYNPQCAAAWTGQVRMLVELGEYREAKLWADKALEHFPNEAELLAAKAVALGRLGDRTGALAFSDASMSEQGDTPYVWLARGDVLLAAREKRAEYCFQKAQALAPQQWLFHWLAARVYYFYKKFSLALKMAQQALALDSGRCVIWLQMGLCQQALGLGTAAKNSFDQAIQLNPRSVAAEQARMNFQEPGLWSRCAGWCRERFRI